MIILGSTPIGNLGDASPRLRETFERVAIVVCEDTRVTANLITALGVTNRPRLIAMHEHNEESRVAKLVELAQRDDILVVSDAGMPTLSDPGYLLVRSAAQAGVEVTVIPGPSAILAALAVSGLATDRFTFEGFLPRKSHERKSKLHELAHETRTMVFFESPHRIEASLSDAREVLGPDRRATVCRELTKKFEQVMRGTLDELFEWSRNGVRGEIVIVIAGASPDSELSVPQALDEIDRLVAAGTSLKSAVGEVAEESGLAKRVLYQGALERRAQQPDAKI